MPPIALATALALGARLGDGAVDEHVTGQPGGHGQAGGDDGPQLPGPSPPPSCQLSLQPQGVLDVRARRSGEAARPRSHAGIGGEPVDVVAVRPASAMATRAASTVRSRSVRPRRRPTGDCPMPEMTARRSRSWSGSLVIVTSRPRRCGPDGRRRARRRRMCSKVTSTSMPMVGLVGLAVSMMLVVSRTSSCSAMVTSADDVGIGVGEPLLLVDGEGVDDGPAAHGLGGEGVGQAVGAAGGGGMDVVAGIGPALEAELAVLPRRPEEAVGVVEPGKETEGGPVGGHRRDGTSPADGSLTMAVRLSRRYARPRMARSGDPMAGRRVLVVGASSGIGRALAAGGRRRRGPRWLSGPGV